MNDKKFFTRKLWLLLLTVTLFSSREGRSRVMLEKATENFMSLKANEVNIRSGPGRGFSIVYTYKLKHVPVRLMGKYDKWFKIADRDGDIGWVSESLLSKIRTVITINEAQLLYYSFTESSFPLCRVEKNVVGRLIKCKKRRCMVKIGKTTGWLSKSDIWGHSI